MKDSKSFTLLYSVNNLLSSYKSNSDEARILRNYNEELQELSKMWDEMLTIGRLKLSSKADTKSIEWGLVRLFLMKKDLKTGYNISRQTLNVLLIHLYPRC